MTSRERARFRRRKAWKDFVKENEKQYCDFCGCIIKPGDGCLHHKDENPENYSDLSNPDNFSFLHRKSCHVFIHILHKKIGLKKEVKELINKYFL
jgi:hypothetical protein